MKIHAYDPVSDTTFFVFNDADYKGYITGKVEGLGPPSNRVSRGSYAGRSGGYSGQRYWDPRLITVTGLLIADTVTEMQNRRADWSDAFSWLDELQLVIQLENGNEYLINCSVDGTPTLDYIPLDPLRAPFSVSFLADDPVIYDNTAGHATSVTLSRVAGGGITWPLSWPLSWPAGAAGSTVNNTGTVPIYPVITLTGSMTNPVLSNQTTGEFISLPGFTAPSDAVVLVDLYNHTITLNGGNVAGLLGAGSSWWGLQKGQNTIKLTTSDVADTVTGTMVWRNGVMGI
jgi:hypothetical protein